MSDSNGWPGKPGVPLNPERDGWHWVGGIPYWWRVFDDDDAPLWQSHHLYFTAEEWSYKKYGGPVLTPAEVDARVSEARRVPLGECISICNAVAHANRVEYPAKWKDRPEGIPHDWQQAWETCAETAEDIAAAIRALGEKE